MAIIRSTQSAPELVVYDGQCSFCKYCIRWLNACATTPIVCIAYQSLNPQAYPINFPMLTDLKTAVYVRTIDKQWLKSAHAVFLLLAYSNFTFTKIFLSLYVRCGVFRKFSEYAYTWIASKRSCTSKNCTF